MAATTQVQVLISAKDDATTVINGVGKAFQNVGGMSAEATKGAGIVSTAFLALGAAAVGVSAVSVKMATDFQSSMTLIQTQAGGSADEVKKMSAAVLNLAGETATAPKTLAEGLFYVESAGYRGAQALDILKLAAEGAKVGHADLAQTANVLTTVMNAHVKGVHNASDAMGILNATVGAGKMHFGELVAAMGTGVLPVTQSLGFSLEDLGAALATMSNQGVNAQDAATRLKTVLAGMEDPTSKATKALASIGVEHSQLANDMRGPGGLVAALQDVNDHLVGVVDPTKKAQTELEIFGGGRMGSAMLTLVNNLDQVKGRLQQIQQTSGNFGSAWQKTQEDNAFAMEKLTVSVQTLMVEFGTALLPAVTQVSNFLSSSLIPALSASAQFVAQHRSAAIALAVVLSGVLIFGIIAVGVVMWTSLIGPAIAFIIWAGGMVFAALGFAVALVSAAIPAIIAFAIAFLPFIIIGAVVIAVVILIMTHLKQLGEFFGTLKHIFTDFFSGGDITLKKHEAGWAGFVVMLLKFRESVMSVFNNVKTIVTNVLQAVETFFVTTWKNITNVFNIFANFVKGIFVPIFQVYMSILKFEITVVWDIFVVAFAAIKFVLTAFGKWLQTTFGPIISLVFNAIKTYLQDALNFWKSIWDFIEETLRAFGLWITNTFGPVIKAIFNTIQGWLQDELNGWKNIWNFIVGVLTNFGNWTMKTFVPIIGGFFDWIGTALQKLLSVWVSIWGEIKSFVAGIANDIMGIVKNMLNSIIGFFNHLISGANSVGSKVPGFVKIGTLPSFQTGGIVPGSIGSPQLIVAHGGETITPIGKSNTKGGGPEVTFNVNIGMYAGTETEKRNLAKTLYAAILDLAQSQHKTVQQYMGG